MSILRIIFRAMGGTWLVLDLKDCLELSLLSTCIVLKGAQEMSTGHFWVICYCGSSTLWDVVIYRLQTLSQRTRTGAVKRGNWEADWLFGVGIGSEEDLLPTDGLFTTCSPTPLDLLLTVDQRERIGSRMGAQRHWKHWKVETRYGGIGA